MGEMDKHDNGTPALWVLAGIGAGVLTGVLLGSVLSKRFNAGAVDPVAESVEVLRDKAQRVLTELSTNVHHIIDRSLESYDDKASRMNPKENV